MPPPPPAEAGLRAARPAAGVGPAAVRARPGGPGGGLRGPDGDGGGDRGHLGGRDRGGGRRPGPGAGAGAGPGRGRPRSRWVTGGAAATARPMERGLGRGGRWRALPGAAGGWKRAPEGRSRGPARRRGPPPCRPWPWRHGSWGGFRWARCRRGTGARRRCRRRRPGRRQSWRSRWGEEGPSRAPRPACPLPALSLPRTARRLGVKDQ